MLLVVKKLTSLSVQDLVEAVRMTVTEFRILRSIVSDTRMNFTLETLREFCRKLYSKNP